MSRKDFIISEDIKEFNSSQHCCRSLKLKRRIYKDELIKMLNVEI